MSMFFSRRGGGQRASLPGLPRVGHFYLNTTDRRLFCLNETARELLREGVPMNAAGVAVRPLLHADGTPARREDLPLVRAWREGTAQEAAFLISMPWAQQVLCYSATPLRDAAGKMISILVTAVLTPPEPDWEELAGMAHDLRSPLQSLRLLVPVLQSSTQPEASAEVLDRLAGAADRAQLIALELLERCRAPVQARKGTPREWTPLQPLLRGLIGEQEVVAQAKGIALKMDLSAVAGVEVHTDRVHLGRLIGNLLGNAVRYTRAGHVRLAARWRAEAEAEQPLVLAVEDTGVGMGAEEQESIFQPYQRGRAGLADPESSGSGVGLATVDRLVSELGLTLEVSSELGRGSRFELVVPAALLRRK